MTRFFLTATPFVTALTSALLALSLNATAQITPALEREAAQRNEQEMLRRQQQERQQREQLERAPDVRTSTGVEVQRLILPVENPCFLIQTLRLQDTAGGAVPMFEWVEQALSDAQQSQVLGQCVGAKGVGMLVEHAQKLLVERGYVTTRMLVSPQDLSQGRLVLTVVPGRIRAIRFSEPVDRIALNVESWPIQAGEVLNLRDIEQALENLKRVPTAEADIKIEPSQGQGAQLGESDLVVSYTQAFPLRLTVSVDDSGTKATGRYQGSVTVSYDNPLRINDMFYVTNTNGLGGGESGPKGTHATTVHYSFPVGYWTWGVTSSNSTYYQTTAGLNGPVLYSGTSENNEFKLNRLVMRDSTQKLNLAVRAFQRKSNNYIDDVEVEGQRRVVGGWDGVVNHKAFIQAATLESNLTYKRATGAFGSVPSSDAGTDRFSLVIADTNLSLPFAWQGQRLRYNGTLRVQENRTALTPQDRFAIGGRYTVRGYDGEVVLSGERGWLLRNDVSLVLGGSGQELYVGLDHGEVEGPSSERLVTKHLGGAALGLRGAIDKLNYDIFVAAPIDKPKNFNTAGYVAGFSLSVSF